MAFARRTRGAGQRLHLIAEIHKELEDTE